MAEKTKWVKVYPDTTRVMTTYYQKLEGVEGLIETTAPEAQFEDKGENVMAELHFTEEDGFFYVYTEKEVEAE